MRGRSGHRLRVMLIIVLTFGVLRLTLPSLITDYINHTLRELPGYHGRISGVSIELLRGAYQIDSLKIFKTDGNQKIPLIDIPSMDLSIAWMAILQGKFVGEIQLKNPSINFIASNTLNYKSEQSGHDVDWTKVIKRLMPLPINGFRVSEGRLAFYDFSSRPHVDLFLQHIQLEAQDLYNNKNYIDQLLSKISASARSTGNGQLRLTMKINVMKKIPDLDMDLKFENLNMRALGDFFEAYAKVDVETGNFNLYSEVAVQEGHISGYIKPLFSNVKAASWEGERKGRPLKLVWEVFENPLRNQLTTHVPVQGRISSGAPFWPVLWNIFRNAFINAFENNPNAGRRASMETPQLKK